MSFLNRKNLLTMALVLLFGAAGFIITRSWMHRSENSLERPARQLKSLEQVTLSDSKGRKIPMSSYTGQPRILYMGYSHCPDMCPMALSNLSRAMRQEPELQKTVQTIFISVDPERDSPDQLGKYERQFAPLRLAALTGAEEEIQTLATDLGASYEKAPATGNAKMGEYGVNHSLFFYFIDEQDRLVATLPSGISPEAILEAVHKHLDP